MVRELIINQILFIASILPIPQSSTARELHYPVQVIAQSPTLERLKKIEKKQREETMNEEAKWRRFPSSPNPPAINKAWWAISNKAVCSYRWPSWKFNPSTGQWMTVRKCGTHTLKEAGCFLKGSSDYSSVYICEEISVSCQMLLITIQRTGIDYRLGGVSRYPMNDGEREMLAALCDTIGKQV